MLQGVQAEGRHRSGVRHVPDAEDTALLVKFVVVQKDAAVVAQKGAAVGIVRRNEAHALALLIPNRRLADRPALRGGVQQCISRGLAASRWLVHVGSPVVREAL